MATTGAEGAGPARVALPCCPITGRPAKRRVHGFATDVLVKIWRVAGGTDLSHLYAGHQQVVLYESDTGLYFFDPPIPGDEAFYTRFYVRVGAHAIFNKRLMSRVEFIEAGKHVPAGAKVLDVGCGMGAFSAHVPHAVYRGLDPFAPATAPDFVIRQTLEQHLETHEGAYDVVTAFQVIEHTRDPKAFAAALLRLLKPGGILIFCAPLHPSPLTEIPNFILNAPPHHLTWWCVPAFEALIAELGLRAIDVRELPPSPHGAIVTWMRRFSFVRTTPPPQERYFAHRWSWHINLALCYLLGRMADAVLPPPHSDRPIDVFMAARKPG